MLKWERLWQRFGHFNCHPPLMVALMKDRNKVHARTIHYGAVATERARDDTKTPLPWIVRERMVALTCGMIGYAGYVYVGRLCLPAIQERPGAQEDKETGVFLLVIFCVPYLWMIWAYMKLILTPPGFAKDHVPKTERPFLPGMVPFRDSNQPLDETVTVSDDGLILYPLSSTSKIANAPHAINCGSSSLASATDVSATSALIANHSTIDLDRRAEELNAIPEPPSTPVLLPAYRYCCSEQLVKPFRADHCRICDMCVLRYDHHCSWIGQCVGARNHKFFINFLQAGVACTCIISGGLGVFILRRPHASSVDPHKLILTLMAGLSGLYMSLLAGWHSGLIIMGQTVPERLKIDALEKRIDIALAQPYPSRPTRMRRGEWDREWGAPGTEGNIWWRGSVYQEWTDVMGKSWLGWILPIGRPMGDGLSYPVNPRFDDDGRWRRRSEWPEALR
ncbi:hypothetical protein D9619_004046 [Psilocybe cf. subviscida]|uniref:Palmitoyltransferase n=1 Tax=Psilocybe cf. subviscida TaxID=2480587 RepID=A0A8H5BNR8_9AGAR|nr:hypothetical protein D9619_004046 [Psilocybe cf. subviscida]